ncbi:MAG TPA: LmeA family phospholipid-binding protein [Fimbriimonadaceae bacterium]|nr:LmeA family phospholipid-binding protein [Fimbriimonadaceae bacterium]
MKLDPLLAGLALAGLYLLGSGEIRKFERLAAEEIRSKLGGDRARVDVRTQLNGLFGAFSGDLRRVTITASDFETDALPLFTEPELSKRGRVRELRISLRNFRLAGLRVDALESSIPDCRFDLGLAMKRRMIRLSQSGVGTGTVRLLDRDLEAFILRKFKEIKRVQVRIEPGKVLVEGYGEFLIIKTNFSVEAKLSPLNKTQLVLTDAIILFDGREADEHSRRVLLETLNPVVDLSKDLGLYDAVEMTDVALREGFLEAHGRTRIPVKPPEGNDLLLMVPSSRSIPARTSSKA